MKVFKFGGASIFNADRIRNLLAIFKLYPDEKILVVISAMGKTTNALEKVADTFYKGEKEEALKLFEKIKLEHLSLAKQLFAQQTNSHLTNTNDLLTDFFTEVEWLLYDKPVRNYDYYYDQIICAGELLSSMIVSTFLNKEKIQNTWVDVRDILRTDDNFRDANVDIDFTQSKINEVIMPPF